MEKNEIMDILLAVVFTTLAIIVPMLFHMIGAGSVFLPMYLPLAVGAFLLTMRNALLVGFMTPLISAFATGMPPFYPPVALIMAVQLSIFCIIISFISAHMGKRVFPFLYFALFPAVLADRLILALFNFIVLPFFSLNPLFVTAYDLLKCAPGIVLIFITVPLVVPRCMKIIENIALAPYEKTGGE